MTTALPKGMVTAVATWTLHGLGGVSGGTEFTKPRGKVTFTPTATAVNLDDSTVLPRAVDAPVVDGVMQPTVLMVNDPDLWNWQVSPRVGVAWPPFHVDVPPEGLDLADAAVVPGKEPVRFATGAFPARATTPTASAHNFTYWVAPDGEDSNAGSEGAPFRSVARALEMVPDLVRENHTYTITLKEGTWDETVRIANKVSFGHIVIQGANWQRDRYRVLRIEAESVLGFLTVRNLSTTVKTAQGASIYLSRCAPMVDISNVNVESNPAIEKGVSGCISILVDYGTHALVRGCSLGGKRYSIRANYLSRVFSRDNTGSGSTFGLGARWGGILSLYGEQPTGDTNYTTRSGGVIARDDGAQLGVAAEPSMIAAVSRVDRDPVRKLYHVGAEAIGHTGDIPPGRKIRARFIAPDGYAVFRVTYATQVSSDSGAMVEKRFSGMVTQTELISPTETVIASQGMDPSGVSLTHFGEQGILDLIVTVPGSIAGMWGVEIDVSSLRAEGGPVMEHLRILAS